jgi:integrase
MGRRANWPPKLTRKPGSTEARTYHAGRWWTCGRWDVKQNRPTDEAKAEHLRLVARWHADPGSASRPAGEYLLSRLLADWAASVDGPATPHARAMLRQATARLGGRVAGPAAEFGPADLVAWQAELGGSLSAQTVRHLRRPVLRAYQWAEDAGRIPEGHAARLWAAAARRGAPGRAMVPRPPAVAADVAAVVADLRGPRPGVAALVEVHALTGARAGELLSLTAGDVRKSGVLRTPRGATLDLTAGRVWAAVVAAHKTAHTGAERVLVFGPKCRTALAPLLAGRAAGEPLFPLAAGRAGQKAYLRAVLRACVRAGVPHFSPRRLRQLAADRVQERFGLEHAAAYLGHGPRGVTARHYLTLALKKAAEAARAVG